MLFARAPKSRVPETGMAIVIDHGRYFTSDTETDANSAVTVIFSHQVDNHTLGFLSHDVSRPLVVGGLLQDPSSFPDVSPDEQHDELCTLG